MKWFKHLSAARRDPKIIALKLSQGREGVCRFWEIVEMVAEQMNETDRCEIIINGPFLSRDLGFRSTKDGLKFIKRLVDHSLIDCTIDGRSISGSIPESIDDRSANEWTIRIPKLLELRDHRIKNRVHKSAPEENRTDVDKKTPIIPFGDDLGFEDFWKKYPERNGAKRNKSKALVEWKKLKAEQKQKSIEVIRPQVEHFEYCKKQKIFAAEFPDAFRWLKNKQFNDEVEKTSLNGSQSTIDPSDDEWFKIVVHLRTCPEESTISGISEIGSNALKRIGGLAKLINTDEKFYHFLQKDFKDEYLAEKRKAK